VRITENYGDSALISLQAFRLRNRANSGLACTGPSLWLRAFAARKAKSLAFRKTRLTPLTSKN
jgi:hypothetical protein